MAYRGNYFYTHLFRMSKQSILSEIRPAARKRERGCSTPVSKANCSGTKMVSVKRTRQGLKFVPVSMTKYVGRFLVILFMDNQLTEEEIAEWTKFSNSLDKFK